MFELPNYERLLLYGSKMVNVQCEPVTHDEFDLLPKLREYMLFIISRYNGIGMASCQVGIFKNFIVVGLQTGEFVDMVNPEILQMWGREVDGFEACLSIPPFGNGCMVPRPQNVKVEYGTSENPSRRETREFSGLDSVVAQHEIDHLTGTFFIDRVKEKARQQVLGLYDRWKVAQVVLRVRKETSVARRS